MKNKVAVFEVCCLSSLDAGQGGDLVLNSSHYDCSNSGDVDVKQLCFTACVARRFRR